MTEHATPRGWHKTLLSEVTAQIVDGSHNPPPKHDDGVPMLSARNVENNRIVLDEFRLISAADFEAENARTNVNEGDVLLTIVGTIGRAAIVPANLKRISLQRSVAVLKPHGLDNRFLMYQLQSPVIQSYFQKEARGTAQKGIYLNQLQLLPVWIAPSAEQERIVAEIEKQLTRLDAAVASLQRVRANLKRYRASVLQAAVEGRLVGSHSRSESGLPADWNHVRVGSFAEIQGGIQKQPKRAPVANAFPYLRVANVLRGRLDLREIHRMELFRGELEKLRLRHRDLLVVEGNGSPSEIGRMAMWDASIADCVHQNHIIRVRCTGAVVPEYIQAFWNSPMGSRQLSQVASSTSGLYTLSVAKVSRIEVPMPPLALQKEIVVEIDRLLSVVDALERSIDAGLKRAERLRQSVLKRAFEGRLVPQDPNDEPASVLLERIRGERLSAPVKGRRARASKGVQMDLAEEAGS